MEIRNQLLYPYLKQIREEFEELDREMSLHGEIEEVLSLVGLTHQKILQIEDLCSLIENFEKKEEFVQEDTVNQAFRKLKLDLRFAQRKWKRYQTTQARLQKMQEKKSHVATFAA